MGNPAAVHIKGIISPTLAMTSDGGEMEGIGASNKK